MSAKLTLQEARAILKRAIEKGREVDWISTHAVVDEGGNVISMSRADGAPSGAAPLARAKAYLAAVTGRPTVLFANRMDAHPLRYFGYRAILPRPVFPGPGAMPVMKDGKAVGGYSSNLSSNAGGMKIEVNGKKLSRADIVTAHAVQAEYLEQHPDVP
jgi:glc operon protein GlcG